MLLTGADKGFFMKTSTKIINYLTSGIIQKNQSIIII